MSRHRFDLLWKHIRFSDQPAERPQGMTSEHYRWKRVDDFVKNFNEHRESTFIPSSRICVDESISRWYGLGGEWIHIGLPMYVAIERKPENGCEIQDAACGKSGIMIRILLVKTTIEVAANSIHEDDNGRLHGTNVLMDLVSPWAQTDRIVCADSYFASVAAALALKEIGLRFIGVVKTATRRFPLTYLSNIELQERGDRSGLIMRGPDGEPSLLAFVWMDRDRRYFIASASSLAEGEAYVRQRWRQVDTSLDADAERVELKVPQPKACEVYYNTCASIDHHNRHRQATLKLETKLKTHEWDRRVNMSIFGMCIVDTWLAWSQCTGSKETQSDFYINLAEEMIDNNYDRYRRSGGTVRLNSGMQGSPSLYDKSGVPRAGVHAHLTPTKLKRKRKDGTLTNQCKQGYCGVCKRKTKYNCSQCIDESQHDEEKLIWLCHTDTGRDCFTLHMQITHEM